MPIEVNMTFRFSLSNALFAITLMAVLVAWYCDHARLAATNRGLNEECAELFMEPPQNALTLINSGGVDWRFTCDAFDPVDRARYKRDRESIGRSISEPSGSRGIGK